MNRLSSIVLPIYQFLFPPVCFVCDAQLNAHERRVCSKCWSTLKPLSVDDPLYREMRMRIASSNSIAELVSMYHFEKEGVLQALLHDLKYNGVTTFGVELGRMVGSALEPLVEHRAIDGLVPVPLHQLKRRERGYNQSEYICRGISRVVNIPIVAKLVTRRKYTQSQTTLGLAERRENVSQAFTLNRKFRNLVQGRTFILVDDVITTGATMESCAEVLTHGGAKAVFACSVALAAHSTIP